MAVVRCSKESKRALEHLKQITGINQTKLIDMALMDKMKYIKNVKKQKG